MRREARTDCRARAGSIEEQMELASRLAAQDKSAEVSVHAVGDGSGKKGSDVAAVAGAAKNRPLSSPWQARGQEESAQGTNVS